MSGQTHIFLVAYPDGYNPKVVRAASGMGAVLSRFKDGDDPVAGVLCAWQLGNFPEQFELVSPGKVRAIGRPSVKRAGEAG